MTAAIRFLLALLLSTTLTAAAQTKPPQPHTRIKVYLVGTFHFDGSATDVVKGSKTDMEATKKQQEVEDLITRLAQTKADKVFVEWRLKDQPFVDSTYALYRNNQFKLGNNEVYQVGYRLASKLKLPRVYCADADGVFDYEGALKYAKAHGQEKTLNGAFSSAQPDSIRQLMEARLGTTVGLDAEQALKDLPNETLVAKLARFNSTEFMRGNMDSYLLTLARVGGSSNYVGADLAGEFYKRNMRIYTNLLRAVDIKHDQSIVLVIGASHVAFLQEQLLYSSLFEVQDVLPLLTTQAKPSSSKKLAR
ncbi:DUF5694 domain-containing protein [Hymenobacter arizonensis]|uniref:TraB/GumN family protein n=1 Tax=Hymenobacter arizonensis TaxID=1227077 RepID=A0A1I5X4Z6_HYMAR|nr:DUF5694 domain-containing protein [Hymenobacter arizonensis]SFQ27030.1 hypothetical protein SAMN04515668_1648 [Hymenobacter arizonensis]